MRGRTKKWEKEESIQLINGWQMRVKKKLHSCKGHQSQKRVWRGIMRVPELVKYDYVALIQRKQTSRTWKVRVRLLLWPPITELCRKGHGTGQEKTLAKPAGAAVGLLGDMKPFAFLSSGFPTKIKFAQLRSLCLTPQEFLWPFSSTDDREETPKILHPLKFLEGSCVVLKKVLPFQPLAEYPSMILMPENKPDRC